MIKNDEWIIEQCRKGMITPFTTELVREEKGCGPNGSRQWLPYPVLSYGSSSFGYDLRLSPRDFKVFRHVPGTIMNPKEFNSANLQRCELMSSEYGQYFILPSHSYGLGVALEKIKMPSNVTGICIGKSTYARLGIIANMTPVEAGWEGHLTLEFSNSSGADAMIFANEGIVQILFFEGEQPICDYAQRNGKYQDQAHQVTTAIV